MIFRKCRGILPGTYIFATHHRQIFSSYFCNRQFMLVWIQNLTQNLILHPQLIKLEELVLTHTNNPDKRRAGRSTSRASIDWTTISQVPH